MAALITAADSNVTLTNAQAVSGVVSVINVLDGDSLNSVDATIQSVSITNQGVVNELGEASTNDLTLNTDGNIDVTAGVFPGTYTLT